MKEEAEATEMVIKEFIGLSSKMLPYETDNKTTKNVREHLNTP